MLRNMGDRPTADLVNRLRWLRQEQIMGHGIDLDEVDALRAELKRRKAADIAWLAVLVLGLAACAAVALWG